MIGILLSCCSRLSRSIDANYKIIPLLIVASIWYLVMTSVLYVGQYFIERRYGRGFTRAEQVTMRARWLGLGRGGRRMTPMVQAEAVHKRFGRLEVLKGITLDVDARRGDVPARAVGLGQVDVPALHQPPREDQRRPAVGRRRAGRLPRGGRQAARAPRARRGAQARGDRDGVPALQPVPAHDVRWRT